MKRAVLPLFLSIAAAAFFWVFPLFHYEALAPAGGSSSGSFTKRDFDPAVAAAELWSKELPAAAKKALKIDEVASEIRRDPLAAKRKYATTAGIGAAYYFVRGRGKVVSRDRNALRISLEDGSQGVVAIRIGPVFGNALRDGCGLLNVNAYPGLEEFNALATELNGLVEKNVLPILREKAQVGASIQFAGCAEAPESVGSPEEPLFTLVPVEAEIQ